MGGKASAYRNEARDLRLAASATTDQVTSETLLKLAEEYERMARYPTENARKVLPSTCAHFILRRD